LPGCALRRRQGSPSLLTLQPPVDAQQHWRPMARDRSMGGRDLSVPLVVEPSAGPNWEEQTDFVIG
jgi:hypothetical protein